MTTPQRSNTQKIVGLLAWVIVSFLPAATAVFVEEPGGWYAALARPAWTPPSWVFSPVWTLLYTLMGVAAWRIWVRFGYRGAPGLLGLYLVHLVFNAAWTWLFFGLNLLVVSAVEIVILWILIGVLTVLFYRRDRIAGALLAPYWLWVTYAVTLNIGFAVMN